MPHSEVHKTKKKKNWAVMGLIFLWCVLIFSLTIVKMARAEPLHHAKSYDMPQGVHEEDRRDYQETVKTTKEEWKNDYLENKAPVRMGVQEDMDAAREEHSNHIVVTEEDWIQDWEAKTAERSEAALVTDETRDAHDRNLSEKPKEWWEQWVEKYNDPDYDKNE